MFFFSILSVYFSSVRKSPGPLFGLSTVTFIPERQNVGYHGYYLAEAAGCVKLRVLLSWWAQELHPRNSWPEWSHW